MTARHLQERYFLLAVSEMIESLISDHESHAKREVKMITIREICDREAWRSDVADVTTIALTAASFVLDEQIKHGRLHSDVKASLSIATRILQNAVNKLPGATADGLTIDDIPF